MSFDVKAHLMDLKGKDYLQVMWRLVWFREEKPNWSIEPEALDVNDDMAKFICRIKDETGRVISAGHGSETIKDFKDYFEKAETKAVGRALAMLGYGTQFAPELDEGERIVDSPVTRAKQEDKPTKEQLLALSVLAQDKKISLKDKGVDWTGKASSVLWTMDDYNKVKSNLEVMA